MTILEALTQFDSLKQNTYQQDDKVRWLSRLDTMVKVHLIDTHEGGEGITFTGYDENTDPETQLLVEEPFAEIYLRWLEAQVDYANAEYNRYNNSIDMFNTVWQAYQNHYNRTHMPKGASIKYF